MPQRRVIEQSIQRGYIHPTTLLNTLIEIENQGGAAALQDLANELAAEDPAAANERATQLRQAWLSAIAQYSAYYGLPLCISQVGSHPTKVKPVQARSYPASLPLTTERARQQFSLEALLPAAPSTHQS